MSIDCVMNRRSVREYTEEAISEEQINTLLKAGMYAPSARNSRPWEFLVVREAESLSALSGVVSFWHMLEHAPLAILVMANLEGYQSSNSDFFIQDCSAAAQNILVAAEGLGLGGVWLGLYGREERMSEVSRILRVPDSIIPFAMLSIGHPKKHPAPHDEFYADKVHYEVY